MRRVLAGSAAALGAAALFAASSLNIHIGSGCSTDCFPDPGNTGTPAGWTPTTTQSTSITTSSDGQVIQDVRLTNDADINVVNSNVTIRRVELQGGHINGNCQNLTIEDSSFLPIGGLGGAFDDDSIPVIDSSGIGGSGYTATRIEVRQRGEGPRVSDCPATITDSFINIQPAADSTDPGSPCQNVHSDGMQAVGGVGATLNNVSVIITGLCGTEGVRFPNSDGNVTGSGYNLTHVLVSGAGQSVSLGFSGTTSGLKVVSNSWCCGGGPLATNVCAYRSPWDAKLVSVDGNYDVTSTDATLNCDGTTS